MKLKPYHTLLLWLIGTFLTIALVGQNQYLALAIALITGILFGIANLIAFQNKPTPPSSATIKTND